MSIVARASHIAILRSLSVFLSTDLHRDSQGSTIELGRDVEANFLCIILSDYALLVYTFGKLN